MTNEVEDMESRPGRRGQPLQDREPMPGAEDAESRPWPGYLQEEPKTIFGAEENESYLGPFLIELDLNLKIIFRLQVPVSSITAIFVKGCPSSRTTASWTPTGTATPATTSKFLRHW